MQDRRRGAGKGIGHPNRRTGGVLDLEPIHPEKFIHPGVPLMDLDPHPGIGAGIGGDIKAIDPCFRPGNEGIISQNDIGGPVVGGDFNMRRVNHLQVVTGLIA